MWKPFGEVSPENALPVFHWSFKYSFNKHIYYTAFFPIAIVLGFGFAIYESCRAAFHTLVLKDKHNGNG